MTTSIEIDALKLSVAITCLGSNIVTANIPVILQLIIFKYAAIFIILINKTFITKT